MNYIAVHPYGTVALVNLDNVTHILKNESHSVIYLGDGQQKLYVNEKFDDLASRILEMQKSKGDK